MLAPSQFPPEYLQWNLAQGAPHGRVPQLSRWKRKFISGEEWERLRGPFAIQPNNSIREFEYPWAFAVGKLQPGMQVLEIGGGLAGFQFVLDQFGCQVVNVDPGMDRVGWPCNDESIGKLNRRFGTRVKLLNTTMDKVSLPDNSFDRIFSISVIEHLPIQDAKSAMQCAHRYLKPGGLFILTCDLFLNLSPFCSRERNEFGLNQNLKLMIDETLWELVEGDRKYLYGFPEFNADFILANLEKFKVGFYPALAQCMVLRKR